MPSYTPMIEQYCEIKKNYPNEILFFRLGDFYEMFFEDAEIASRELEITLTARDGGTNIKVPMCGVPYHAADNYIAKLITKGYKVAICEQVEDPKQAKGIVRREVVKIITPGTMIAQDFLQDAKNNFVVSLHQSADKLSFAAADISTGEFFWAEFLALDELLDHLFVLMPVELILAGDVISETEIVNFVNSRLINCVITHLDIPDESLIKGLSLEHFPEKQLPSSEESNTAVGCLLYYLHDTVKAKLAHINTLTRYRTEQYLVLDAATLRNLELTRSMRDGSRHGTLLSVLDFTKTAMGSRLLKRWLECPLLNAQQITERQDAVEELIINATTRKILEENLVKVYDLERILTRIELGTANARDLLNLKQSLAIIPEVKEQIANFKSRPIKDIYSLLSTHQEIVELIECSINEENPPISIRDGGIIKGGYNKELDDLRNLAGESKCWIHELETNERHKTGIKSLKVGYNKVFGYYIEVTHANSSSVPANYIRKQTLANAERYITPELKEFETKILGANERILNIEYQLFCEIREHIKSYIASMQNTAKQLALIDVFLSLAEAAVRYNYNRPSLRSDGEITIYDGRHPVVEQIIQKEMFVPNDTKLGRSNGEIIIITGPNMAGKSTYMRQVALLMVMTQIGSFIPAREARITPVDRIFTRVGASDDLATGQSTFMVEMNEVAHILNNATSKSLIVLDEIGRGTSTYDGMSIARAVIEFIAKKINAKTLFATHYHELTELEKFDSKIKNYSVAVKERGRSVDFLHRIIPGGTDKSYGIHVAQLAGLPKWVIDRSFELLKTIEESHRPSEASAVDVRIPQTVNIFEVSLLERLVNIDVMSLTPIEALNLLYKWQQEAKREMGMI